MRPLLFLCMLAMFGSLASNETYASTVTPFKTKQMQFEATFDVVFTRNQCAGQGFCNLSYDIVLGDTYSGSVSVLAEFFELGPNQFSTISRFVMPPLRCVVAGNICGMARVGFELNVNTATKVFSMLSVSQFISEGLSFRSDTGGFFFVDDQGDSWQTVGATLSNLNMSLTPVPLPASAGFILFGLGGLLLVGRKRAVAPARQS